MLNYNTNSNKSGSYPDKAGVVLYEKTDGETRTIEVEHHYLSEDGEWLHGYFSAQSEGIDISIRTDRVIGVGREVLTGGEFFEDEAETDETEETGAGDDGVVESLWVYDVRGRGVDHPDIDPHTHACVDTNGGGD